MKNLLSLLALSLILAACSGGSDSAQPESESSEPSTNQPQQAPQTPLTQSSTQAYSRAEGRGMLEAFRSKLGTDQMKNLSFPNSMIIEKKFVEDLLATLNNNGGSGGLILYPVISAGTGQFSVAVAPASFKTDAEGRYSTGDIEVLYMDKNGVPSVYETLMPCPTFCPTKPSDLSTQ